MTWISNEKIQTIRRLRTEGKSVREIAETVGCSCTTVYVKTSDIIPKRTGRCKGTVSPKRQTLIHSFCERTKAVRETAAAGRGKRYPCEHCRWRRNKEPRPICIGYCELIDGNTLTARYARLPRREKAGGGADGTRHAMPDTSADTDGKEGQHHDN